MSLRNKAVCFWISRARCGLRTVISVVTVVAAASLMCVQMA